MVSRCRSCVALTSQRARLCHTHIPRYCADDVESKWQAIWRDNPPAKLDKDDKREKFYVLSMFPYPSGLLHMGHVRVYAISDALAHYHRMRGKKVLHPMGWDSFGLPAENAAIDNSVSPSVWTEQNISQMKAQQLSLGIQFDWDKELSTCSPDYYRWTQWLFIQLYKHGLAYHKEALVNWDPVDCSVLANEQVDQNGRSWRSGAKVEQRYLKQWFLKISSYSERLLSGLDELNWPKNIKNSQASWIDRSEGAVFEFKIETDHEAAGSLKVFTAQPETVYGVSYLAISPDHELIREGKLVSPIVLSQVKEMFLNRGHTIITDKRAGLDLGVRVTHPLTGTSLPVYVADYVADYRTDIVMGVPSVDKIDGQFATAHGLPVTIVIETDEQGNTVLVNSAQFSRMSLEEGKEAIVDHTKMMGCGSPVTNYRLRDWLISRQRYWGAPIPMLHCQQCGVVPVPEDHLPVCLPKDVQLTGRGPSPLLKSTQWLNSGTCGKPGCTAKRDPDTMDTFMDSSWYFLRYIDPHNDTKAFDTHLVNQWMPVDIYVGGEEHACLHHLYARFITHFLADAGFVKHREPFKHLLVQGMVQSRTYRMAESGQYLLPKEVDKMKSDGRHKELVSKWEKMSKSKHNGVNPADLIKQYGADTIRVYVLKTVTTKGVRFDYTGLLNMHQWLCSVWDSVHQHINACSQLTAGSSIGELSDTHRHKIVSATNKTVREVTRRFENKERGLSMGLPDILELIKFLQGVAPRERQQLLVSREYHTSLTTVLQLMSPLAPHITSQLWEDIKTAGRILGVAVSERGVLQEPWPDYTEAKSEEVKLSIRVDAIWKENIPVSPAVIESDEAVIAEAMKSSVLQGLLEEGIRVNRTIFVPTKNPSWRGINFVTKQRRN